MKWSSFCEFFASIEADPEQIVTDFTIGDYLGARIHLQKCVKCVEAADRIEAKNPDKGDDTGTIGFNVN